MMSPSHQHPVIVWQQKGTSSHLMTRVDLPEVTKGRHEQVGLGGLG